MRTKKDLFSLQWQVCHAKKKKKEEEKEEEEEEEEEEKEEKEEEEEEKADLTTVLHIRELPHLHMKLAVWFTFPTTNNKNPMTPS